MHTPARLQEYGVGIFRTIPTKSALKKALKKELITVNGITASTATFIRGDETICLNVLEKPVPKKIFICKLKVLFEDDYLALIHKPSGILVSGNKFKTITNALPQNLKPSTLTDAARPQPVHRLDYATTGILLIGKTYSSIRTLNKLFENKAVKKTYFAVTIGEILPRGTIDSSIDGKASQSDYRLLESVTSKRFGKLNLVQLEPKTGRRHQLRKHLASIGAPILGDAEYGKEDLVLKGKGLYLHAFSLQFVHPFTKQEVHLKDELPKKFAKIFSYRL
jgi:23S rRNA pseudouridine1911/1915/1917 synthase